MGDGVHLRTLTWFPWLGNTTPCGISRHQASFASSVLTDQKRLPLHVFLTTKAESGFTSQNSLFGGRRMFLGVFGMGIIPVAIVVNPNVGLDPTMATTLSCLMTPLPSGT